MPVPCQTSCELCADNPLNMNELRLEEAIHCNCFKLSELMKRNKILPECNQCVNLNCTIGVQNYLALCDLVKIKDIEGGGVR